MKKTGQIFHTVTVKPGGGRDYPILIGTGLFGELKGIVQSISGKCRVLVVTDKNVAKHHADSCIKGLKGRGIEIHVEELPAGERYKTMNTYRRLIQRLADLDGAGDLVVVALGGGVVGDIAGFAAATYRRGIPCIQVPTTLLASVDSSVGGKTGIDLKEGKNLVGSFFQPGAVIINLDTLSTLPRREIRAGIAEVIKYGFIMDKRFAAYCKNNMDGLLSLDDGVTSKAVKRSCELKAKVVRMDERDTAGIRAILNYGHTFAHAFETACGYGRYRHGEAVGAGMVCAADLSVLRGNITQDDADLVEEMVASAGLPTSIKGTNVEALVSGMKKDKKTKGGKVRFVLLKSIGEAYLDADVMKKDVTRVLRKRLV